LAETASLEGIEEAGEGFDGLPVNQSKERRPPISTRDKSTFLVIAKPPFSYRRILNKGEAEGVLKMKTRL
jgi:hypothetical protein